MKRLLAGLAMFIAVASLSGCYINPGYSYVRGNGYGGDAYYGSGPAVVYGGAYDPGYYGYGYGYGYGAYGYGYGGCCFAPGVFLGGGWYGGRYYRGGYYRGGYRGGAYHGSGGYHGGGHYSGGHGGGHYGR